MWYATKTEGVGFCPDVKSECDTHLQSKVSKVLVMPAGGSPYPQYEDYVWLLSLNEIRNQDRRSRFLSRCLIVKSNEICNQDRHWKWVIKKTYFFRYLYHISTFTLCGVATINQLLVTKRHHRPGWPKSAAATRQHRLKAGHGHGRVSGWRNWNASEGKV